MLIYERGPVLEGLSALLNLFRIRSRLNETKQGGMMAEQTKRCPMCAEEIKIEALVCRYCKAKFNVTIKGYCPRDRQLVDADANGRCPTCAGELTDTRVVSTLIEEKNLSPARPVPSPKKSFGRVRGCIIGVCLLVGGLSIMALTVFRSAIDGFLAAQIPEFTSIPQIPIGPQSTRTTTPMPVEVNFTNIYDYPLERQVNIVGQLMLPSRVRQDDNCGVFLRNPTKYHEKITIFLFIPLPGNTPLPNQMARLPDPYSEQDFEVRLEDGSYVGSYATVRITGSICETTDGDFAICNISRIESAEPTAGGSGIVEGRILWNSQPIAGVTVKLCTDWVAFKGCETKEYTAITGDDGRYRIEGLPTGKYDFITSLSDQESGHWWIGKSADVVSGQIVTIDDVSVSKSDLKLTAPANGTTVTTDRPTLEWEPYPDAAYYEVSVLRIQPLDATVDDEKVSQASYVFKNPLAPAEYGWSIRAYTAAGVEIAKSESFSFVVP